MSRRNTVNGRPSGTDGSDFSYRMVVDSRYTRVAEGKFRLSLLFYIQGLILSPAAVVVCLSAVKGEGLDTLSAAYSSIYLISLFIGQFGLKRSRINLLKLYLFGSSVAALISVASILKREKSTEILKGVSKWEASQFEVLEMVAILLAVLVQIFAVGVTTSLLGNMAPPKRAS